MRAAPGRDLLLTPHAGQALALFLGQETGTWHEAGRPMSVYSRVHCPHCPLALCSYWASSVSVYNKLLETRPDLVEVGEPHLQCSWGPATRGVAQRPSAAVRLAPGRH